MTDRPRRKRVAIVQALPLEYYPPVTNLLGFLSTEPDLEVAVFTVHNPIGREAYVHPAFRIHRFPMPQAGDRVHVRLWKHLLFTVGCVRRLRQFKPQAILYYEPHSAMPAYIYSRYCDGNTTVLIHNHEYYEPAQFERPGMRLVKWSHSRETGHLYRKAAWISQTNQDRLRFFLQDYPFIDHRIAHALPNYPPRAWIGRCTSQERTSDRPLRLVHVGAVSLEDSHVREICEWTVQKQGKVTLDFYDYKIPKTTRSFLANMESPWIRCFDRGVPYAELPTVLGEYHVGLVLHRGTNVNYTYNAPNKLFEYLACGLDVWCPREMQGTKPYLCSNARPRVVAVDFAEEQGINSAEASVSNAQPFVPSSYCFEDVLPELVSALRQSAGHSRERAS